jgi:hypothetical protein
MSGLNKTNLWTWSKKYTRMETRKCKKPSQKPLSPLKINEDKNSLKND